MASLGLGLGLSDSVVSAGGGGGGGVTYTGWTKTGSNYTTGSQVRVTELVEGSRLAVADSGGIEAVTWGGSSFSKVGNTNVSLTTGNNATIEKQADDSVWYINGTALQVWDFDGTDWSFSSHSLSITVSSYPSIAYLTDGACAVWTNNTLTKYTYSGSGNPVKVGNSLSLSGNYHGLTGLGENTVLIQDTATDDIQVYTFDGTDWSKASTTNYSMSTAESGVYEPAKLSSTQAIVWDGGSNVRAVNWNGSDTVAAEGSAGTATGASSWPRSLAKYSDTLVGFVSFSGDLGMMEATTE